MLGVSLGGVSVTVVNLVDIAEGARSAIDCDATASPTELCTRITLGFDSPNGFYYKNFMRLCL